MQQQLSEMQRQLEEASEGAYDITRDMTRQYKGMQEELLNRINQLEGSIQVCVACVVCQITNVKKSTQYNLSG
jgi:phosphate uptake regulator